jgi:hypothetical protein
MTSTSTLAVFCLTTTPLPLVFVSWSADWKELGRRLDVAMMATSGTHCLKRCVGPDRLGDVLANGIDVQPATSGFYAESAADKAVEYGGKDNKVLMAFDMASVERSFVVLDPAIEPETIRAAESSHPTRIKLVDGKWWYSKLTVERGAGTPYEAAYGWCLKVDAFTALKFVIVLCRDIPQAVSDTVPRIIDAARMGVCWKVGEDASTWAAAFQAKIIGEP